MLLDARLFELPSRCVDFRSFASDITFSFRVEINVLVIAVWKEAHYDASTALEDREDRLSAVYEEIERDLTLIGATAIEDKLQVLTLYFCFCNIMLLSNIRRVSTWTMFTALMKKSLSWALWLWEA